MQRQNLSVNAVAIKAHNLDHKKELNTIKDAQARKFHALEDKVDKTATKDEIAALEYTIDRVEEGQRALEKKVATKEEAQALEQGQKALKEAQEAFDKKLDRLINLLGSASQDGTLCATHFYRGGMLFCSARPF